MTSNTERNASPAESALPEADIRFFVTPDPPRPHRWFLVLTGVLLAAWMIFLAYLAFSSRLGRGL